MNDAPLPRDIAANRRLSRWVRVGADGTIEVFAGKVELGQGIRTTQLQIAADELEVEPSSILLCVGDTATCPDQGLTAGSVSTEIGGMALRRVCAEVRQLFVVAAGRRLSVDPRSVSVEQGRFSSPHDHRTVGYGDLADDVDLDRDAAGDASPKAVAERRVVGTSMPRPDLAKKLFGAAFIHDIEWPGMLHGRVVRPASYDARLEVFSVAAQHAVRTLPGVHTLYIEGRFIAVAAEREEQAVSAAAAVQRAVQWGPTDNLPAPSTDQAWLRALETEDSVVDACRQVDEGTPVMRRFMADYSRPFLAHASIGPSCALARWDDGHLTVCTHSQGSFTLRIELANYLDIDAARVTVIHADGAGCYGHNGADDAAIDAAIVARAVGRPVRLQWSREDEFRWAPFGSAMSIRIAAAIDADGRIVDWHHEGWSHSHVQRPGQSPDLNCLAARLREPPVKPPAPRDFPLPAGGGERNAVPIYRLPTRRIDYHLVTTPTLRTSALRALGAYANVFAIESAMDELAALAIQNPLAFRLAHLRDPRAVAVLHAAASAAGWGDPKEEARQNGAARGRGLALARYKNTGAYCAVVVEVEVAERIVLDRVWVAVDAGEVINPDGLVNQIEGGVLQAASWTLKEEVRWGPIGVAIRSWDDYPILNFDEAPRTLDVGVIAHAELPPLGVGECAAGPTAAAIANAVADAMGLRVRHLPLTPERMRKVMDAEEGGPG